MSLKKVEEKEKIDEDFRTIDFVLKWQRWFLTVGGLWPMEPTYIRAAVWQMYMTLHLITEYMGLFAVFGDLSATVLSTLEVSMQSMVYAKLIVFRHSPMLRKLITMMREEFSEEFYDDYEEKKLYLKFNGLAKMYVKFTMPYILSVASLYYMRPILIAALTGNFLTNDSMVLPFRTTLPFSTDDPTTYLMTYAYMAPVVYMLACHNAWICLLITIQLHICGQLSIVEYRIRKIGPHVEHPDNQVMFKILLKRHVKSIWMANSFDDSFHFILLIDLVVMTLLLGLMAFVIITAKDMSDSTVSIVYSICGFATLILIYCYCIVGESLITESKKVHAAYCDCLWYESSTKFKRSMMICLLESQEPLRMTAGKFFVFSLTGFTDILKTAMGYLSMLRKVSQ